MSFDYRGCFLLGEDPIDPARLEATLTSFGLAFAGVFAALEYEAGRLREKAGVERDFAAFVADGNGPSPSAFVRLRAQAFRFDFGFVALPGARAAWLEISDQQLYNMADALEDQAKNLLQFFAELHAALNARSMAFGMETSALQFLKFFGGQLPLADVDQQISTAIAPPFESAAAMRQSPWLREIDVNGVQVLTRYLTGLEVYYPEAGT
jgi:hypothetical protein